MQHINLSLKEYSVLIVKPEINISTAEAYSFIKPRVPEKSIREIIQLPINEWKNNLKNDFEKTMTEKFPVIGKIKNKMYAQGALYSSMSGSGSAVYGIFKENNFDKNSFSDCAMWEGVLS